MIKYWPNKPGIDLNLEVANLFKRTYLKLNKNLYNQTSSILSIDILSCKIKKKLFNIILVELEILILDLIELDLTVEDIKILNKKIILDLLGKSLHSFQVVVNKTPMQDYKSVLHIASLNNVTLNDHRLLLEYLLIYLIFGSSSEQNDIYQFIDSQVPLKHVDILLDNLLIQVADAIFRNIIHRQKSLSALFLFLKSNHLCNDTYISIRSIATFKNNIVWQYFINYYFTQPKVLYSNRYQVWILSPQGLRSKYIYVYREENLSTLSNVQVLVTGILELQDFILPKITALFVIISKIWIYLFSNALKNILELLWRSFLLIIRTEDQ
uniref:Uncharacterized protein n=1 Tax=Balbiania investiens TaxID=111861 RepID=A0A4D6BNL1_9FLOR|nr:hypothetical protein [Balbiania investiens]QBX88543.1 hypothetical protein [Balbiania investiens]